MNRLGKETSPYLRQHADNPVDWYPWCKEALARARREDRPILLSIGYSACHWCHVMAHESFADEATAALMNRHFINIKVDREERPDLDRIYQLSHQLLTQRGGGWPLTLFLSPHDLVAFFAGTYFPPTPRYGLPGFPELLERVAAYYHQEGGEIRAQNQRLREALASLNPSGRHRDALDATPLDLARHHLGRAFDTVHGGFGGAPKFPQPPNLERLLRHWAASGEQQALEMVRHTLTRMAAGGLRDHLGGGFYRYAVDQDWQIPHFEKMLYDNAQLLALYAQAWAAGGGEDFAAVAHDTARWVLDEMRAPGGAFHAALDADSEGEEGRYYVWRRDEVETRLDPAEYAAFASRYGLGEAANFEGRWHLRRAPGEAPVDEATQALLDGARRKLLAARRRRVPPGLDDKILTAWNALMIRGLAIAARHLGEDAYGAAADEALAFIRRELWRDGRLLATWKDGAARLPAYLDDYAFLLDAVLELLQLRWRRADLDFAVALAEVLLDHFADPEQGGFYFTADDHEALVYRPKPYGDDAIPAGNGVAARALLRLGHLLGEPRYLAAAEGALRNAWPAVMELPHGHNTLLTALEEYLQPPSLIVLRGAPEALAAWQEACLRPYAPRRLCLAIPAEETQLPPPLAGCRAEADVVAYVCHGTHCSAPLHSLEALQDHLRDAS